MKFILLKLQQSLISNFGEMDELQKMLQNTIEESNHTQKLKSIEKKFNTSKQYQNQYQFPRKRTSDEFSIPTSSFQHESYYNLYKQNQKENNNITFGCVKSKTKRLKLNKQNLVTHILQVKKIKQYTKKYNQPKQQRLKLTKIKKCPEQKVIKLCQSLKHLHLKTSIFNTPEKNKEFQMGQIKTKSKNKRKLIVLSAHAIRRIEDFNIESKNLSPKKGLALCSKQKRLGVQVRAINIF